jgi:TRAP transporter TAXI family solute receptor
VTIDTLRQIATLSPSALRVSVGLLVSLLAVASMAPACQRAPAPAKAASPLRVLMHPEQRERIGETLKLALRGTLPDTIVDIREEIRETEIVRAIQDEQADLAFAYADIAYLAYAGELDGRPFDRLRGIATLNTSLILVLVRANSRINDLADLRGRKVNLGLPGSNTALTVQIVLSALGNDVTKTYEPFEVAVANLANGSLDAMVVLGDGPRDDDVRKAIANGARILSLSDSTTVRLRRRYPFVLPLVVPGGVHEDGPVVTIGIERLLICREGLDKAIVYAATQAFFESLPRLSALDPQLRQMNVENSQATPVPLHPGAARYYREQEQM